tara:strand:+ start:185 stop:364 length:180 start_codon:yes stop_codon:yes gene_type:complete
MANKQKHRVSNYRPRPDSVSNEPQSALYDAMKDMGKTSMKISDIPKFLKQTKKELNKGK